MSFELPGPRRSNSKFSISTNPYDTRTTCSFRASRMPAGCLYRTSFNSLPPTSSHFARGNYVDFWRLHISTPASDTSRLSNTLSFSQSWPQPVELHLDRCRVAPSPSPPLPTYPPPTMTPRLVSLILAFFAAGSTVAGTLISPTAGQRLSAHKPFTVEYNSDRYFLESSIAISIVISTDKKGLNGTLPFKDHPPTNHTGRYNSATYKLEVQPPFFLRDVAVPADGKHTVYVLENYYPAYGGHTALEVTGVPVTFF